MRGSHKTQSLGARGVFSQIYSGTQRAAQETEFGDFDRGHTHEKPKNNNSEAFKQILPSFRVWNERSVGLMKVGARYPAEARCWEGDSAAGPRW